MGKPMADPPGVEDAIALDRATNPHKYSRGSWSPWDEIERLRGAEERAIGYARSLAELREAACALLHHDTEENRSRLYALIDGPGSPQWEAECEEFGCTDTGR
jgi:hypothetical protein